MQRDRARVGPEQTVHRRVDAQALLDGVGDQAAVGLDERHLLGMAHESADQIPDEQRRGRRTGDEQELAESNDLLLAELVAVALDGQQPRQQIVGHIVARLDRDGSLLDVRAEVGVVLAVGVEHVRVGGAPAFERDRFGHRQRCLVQRVDHRRRAVEHQPRRAVGAGHRRDALGHRHTDCRCDDALRFGLVDHHEVPPLAVPRARCPRRCPHQSVDEFLRHRIGLEQSHRPARFHRLEDIPEKISDRSSMV